MSSNGGNIKELSSSPAAAQGQPFQSSTMPGTSAEALKNGNNNNIIKDAYPTVLERLAKEHEMKEAYISITMPPEADSLEITLSSNLIIKSIKENSCALYQLIIGDQILNIGGHVPTSSEHVIELIRRSKPSFVLTVNRPQNHEPVMYSRAASIQLKRNPGYAYFVVSIKRIEKIHLGLGIRAYRGKITVNRTDENSLAAFAYLVGDTILDVNCEKITDVQILQKRLIDSLVKYGACNTVIERPESSIALHNTRTVTTFLNTTANIDPSMPGDCLCIAQREIVRHRANMNRNAPKGVYRNVQPAKNYIEKNGDAPGTPKATESNKRKTKSKSKDISESIRSLRRKKASTSQLAKKVVSFSLKPIEVQIASDVQNAMFLQKVESSNKRNPHALTFMPKIFTQGLSRIKNNGNSTTSNDSTTTSADKSGHGSNPPSPSSPSST